MKENPLLEKSLCFAARIVKLYQYFSNEKKESVNIFCACTLYH